MRNASTRSLRAPIGVPLAVALILCGSGLPPGGRGLAAASGSGSLTIYTSRDEGEVKSVTAEFTRQHPEYAEKVQYLILGAQDSVDRIRAESGNPQGGFLWGGTPQTLAQLAREHLLEPYTPTTIDSAAFNPEYRDAERRWWAEILLPEVIIYNSDLVKPEDAPKDWPDLLDPRWKGKILIRDVIVSGTMRSIFDAFIYRRWKETGKYDAGYDDLLRLDANTVNYAANPNDLYLKLDRGIGEITLWNLQDVFIQSISNHRPWGYVMPTSGAPTLTDGVGVIANPDQEAAARAFEDFLLEPKTQADLCARYYQIPAGKTSTAAPEWLAGVHLKVMEVNWREVAAHEKEWMAYWQNNIKGKGRARHG